MFMEFFPTSLMFSFTSNVVNSDVVVVSGNGGLVSYALLVHASLFPEIYDLTSDWFPRCRENKLYTAYKLPVPHTVYLYHLKSVQSLKTTRISSLWPLAVTSGASRRQVCHTFVYS